MESIYDYYADSTAEDEYSEYSVSLDLDPEMEMALDRELERLEQEMFSNYIYE